MMAKTEQMIYGRMGNAIFYRVGEETRVRSTAANFQDANTAKQQVGRSRLRVATFYYQHLTETLSREIWKLAAKGTKRNGFNLFMKMNMTVFNPDGKIGDFSLLQLTAGALQKVNHLEATVDERDQVTLTWEGDINLPSARKDDRLTVVVLYGDRSFSPLIIKEIHAERKDGKALFGLNRKRGIAAHVYCFFAGKEGNAYSTSQYVQL